jgi:hypothetical protein
MNDLFKRYFDSYKYVVVTPWKDILMLQVCSGEPMERYFDTYKHVVVTLWKDILIATSM